MQNASPELSPALRAAIEGLERHLEGKPLGTRVRPGCSANLAHRARPWPSGQECEVPPESAMALAEALRSGATRVERVVGDALARAEKAEHLNAFITIDPERFREEAVAAADLIGIHPLAGVPIAHKDIIATEGIPTTGGSRSRADWIPDRDAEVVRRLRVRGLPSLGKTNTHELATGITGQVSASGAVGNPWGDGRMTGGSSSGAAAAVAAGVVPLATATDTGGSARIPAACGGVVGFKPTYGTVPTGGVIPFSWTLDHVGAMARFASDLHALAPALGVRGATGQQTSARGLRFALPEHLLDDADRAIARRIVEVAQALEADGAARVEPAWPDWFDQADGVAAAIFLREGAAVHAEVLRSRPDLLESPTRSLLESAAAVSDETYRRALLARSALIAAAEEFFRDVDVLVSPALPTVAPSATEETIQLPGGPTDVRAALTRYTRLWNVCGNPVVCSPCGLADGLPAGVQFIGPRGHDRGLLGLAARYERLRGPFPLPGKVA